MTDMTQFNSLETNARPQTAGQKPITTNSQPRPWLWLAVIAAVIAAVVVAVGVTGAAYIWFSGGSGSPSSEVTAPVLTLRDGDTRTRFHITSEASEARFIIDETLLDQPKTVVGATNQVAGELLVDFDHPANTQVGAIRINVRTLETDNEFRNRALRGQILQADRDEFEFAQFIPTALTNLPEQITLGQPVTFQIQGQLSLHGVSRNVVFDATVTPLSETQLEGLAQATVSYRDFGMNIPEAPGVANVSEDVQLEIEFLAEAA